MKLILDLSLCSWGHESGRLVIPGEVGTNFHGAESQEARRARNEDNSTRTLAMPL